MYLLSLVGAGGLTKVFEDDVLVEIKCFLLKVKVQEHVLGKGQYVFIYRWVTARYQVPKSFFAKITDHWLVVQATRWENAINVHFVDNPSWSTWGGGGAPKLITLMSPSWTFGWSINQSPNVLILGIGWPIGGENLKRALNAFLTPEQVNIVFPRSAQITSYNMQIYWSYYSSYICRSLSL